MLQALAFFAGTQVPPAARPSAALAFDNRLPKDELELKYKTPRTPGPKPIGIGPTNGNKLKPCTDGKPHCFSSSPEEFEDNDLYQADYGTTEGWLVPPFKFDKPLSEAFSDVKAAVASYPPGQRGIDGGGWKVVDEQTDGKSAYVYVQFESRRKGYIDDLELALKDGVCNVRTSSRLGYLDYGVNAKRLNWFSERLGQAAGWRTAPLLRAGHEEYFTLNGVKDGDMQGGATGQVVAADKVKLDGAGFRPPGL